MAESSIAAPDAQTVPTRADARRNYERILTVANQNFLDHGLRTSLDEIARQAGVGPGTLYRHFPTREDLVAAALAENMVGLAARAEQLNEEKDPTEALKEWIGHLTWQVSAYGGLPEAILQASTAKSSPLGVTCRTLEAHTSRLLERAIASGGIRADVKPQQIFLLTSALAWIRSQPEEGEAAADRHFEIYWRGMVA